MIPARPPIEPRRTAKFGQADEQGLVERPTFSQIVNHAGEGVIQRWHQDILQSI